MANEREGKMFLFLEDFRFLFFDLFCFLVGSAFGYHVLELRVTFPVSLQSLWDKIKGETM